MDKTKSTTKERPQCSASFQTPDGRRWYCQHRGRAGHAGDHFFNVVRHPIVWQGSSEENGPHCGFAGCPGRAGVRVAEEIAMDPAANDAAAEAEAPHG